MAGKNHIRPSSALLAAAFIAGAAIMLYPTFAKAWNHIYQKRLAASYEQDAQHLAESGGTSYEYERRRAVAYNGSLLDADGAEALAFLDGDSPDPEYMGCLNLNGDGIMGYVTIPKINVEIPIYHTASDEAELAKGAGHLEGTSLPVGGESTHCVIAAHRGLPGSMLFTDLDELSEGDHFILTVLGEKLCYEVTEISVVLPEETESLAIREGQDLCTLLTCTPYGVNDHRLLVTGRRVPYSEAYEEESRDGIEMSPERWLLIFGCLAAAAGAAYVTVQGRRTRGEPR